jgi:hypothetical protein
MRAVALLSAWGHFDEPLKVLEVLMAMLGCPHRQAMCVRDQPFEST